MADYARIAIETAAVPSDSAPVPAELTDMERGLIDAMLELYYGIPQKPPSAAASEQALVVIPSKRRRAKSRTEPKQKTARRVPAMAV